MSHSGIKCDPNVKEMYEKVKKGKAYRWLIYRLTPDFKKIVFEKGGERDDTFADFKTAIPDDDARYCSYDFDYTTKDGRPTSKLVSFYWCPDDKCKVKNKMVYSSSKTEIVKTLNLTADSGKILEIHAEDELDEDNIINEATNNRTK